jgi:hypothetical protein
VRTPFVLAVETVFFRRYYVLFFIAHASRRILAGRLLAQSHRRMGHPAGTQSVPRPRGARRALLIRDRDMKYSGSFDGVLRARGIRS